MRKVLLICMFLFFSFNLVAAAETEILADEDIYKNGLFDNLERDFPGVKILEARASLIDNDLTTSGIFSTFVIVNFDKPITLYLKGLYLNRPTLTNTYTVTFQLGDEIVYSQNGTGLIQPINRRMTIDKAVLKLSRQILYELEFLYEAFVATPHENLKIENITTTSADISWVNAKRDDLEKTEIYVNGERVDTVSNIANSYKLENLKMNSEYKVEVYAVYDGGKSVAISKNFKTLTPGDLLNSHLSVSNITNNSALLRVATSKMPDQPTKVILYDNKNKVLEEKNVLKGSDTTFNVTKLQESTSYTYKLQIKHGDIASTIRELSFKTLQANRDVQNLRATSTAEDVSLNWNMPSYDSLDFARIYRKEPASGFVATVARFFSGATDGYNPIFETNGTTFKDLTVKSDTEYMYKVTTVDLDSNESNGITVSVKTKKVTVSGGGINIDPNGNYIIKWDSPTTGQMKVLIAGVEYKIVPAADKKIIIPKADMKFDAIGNPDVLLIPITNDGVEGGATKPGGGLVDGGIGGDLTAPNTLETGVLLLMLVGGFLLLGLSFRIVPKLINLIRNAFINKNRLKNEQIGSGRRTSE